MFEWFKRRIAAAAAAQPRPQVQQRPQPTRAGPPSGFGDTAALPEVVNEGNTHADWSMWEDSMTALDSQMAGLAPSARIYVRSPRPSQFDEIDAFERVAKNGS
jgi:hypothetical protein